jgi:hypothetical protein
MTKFVYSFALVIALITGILCVFKGISPLTTLFRSAIVYIGVVFIFFVAANLLRWSMILSFNNDKVKDNK